MRILIIVMVLVTMTGCSVMTLIDNPPPANYEIAKPPAPRSIVVGQFARQHFQKIKMESLQIISRLLMGIQQDQKLEELCMLDLVWLRYVCLSFCGGLSKSTRLMVALEQPL